MLTNSVLWGLFNMALITGWLSRILKNFGTNHEFRIGIQVKVSLYTSLLRFQTRLCLVGQGGA